MNTIVLALENDSKWSPQDWLEQQGGVKLPAGQVTLEKNKMWISIILADNLLTEFDEEEKNFLLKIIENPKFYLIEWNGDDLIEYFLKAVPSDCTAVVDNDHGLITSVQSVRNRPAASWMRSSLPI